MNSLSPQTLTRLFVQLEPLAEQHRNELRAIGQDENIWTYFPYSAACKNFDRWFEEALQAAAKGQALPFAVRHQSDQSIIGSTRYYDLALHHRRLRVGYTWYTQALRGTAINPECKLLLLTHAFETLAINRVEFSTDARNLHSKAAIKKLGATEEGLLRQHMILEDGYIRDTIMFSILQSEWPAVKQRLLKRLQQEIQ